MVEILKYFVFGIGMAIFCRGSFSFVELLFEKKSYKGKFPVAAFLTAIMFLFLAASVAGYVMNRFEFINDYIAIAIYTSALVVNFPIFLYTAINQKLPSFLRARKFK